jgi:hypothetical protein
MALEEHGEGVVRRIVARLAERYYPQRTILYGS